MQSFRRLGWIVGLIFFSSLGYTADIPPREISAFYTSFYPNVGGLPEIGARFRIESFEVEAMTLSNALAVELGYSKRVPVGRFFAPRFILGAAYAFGAPGLVGGIDLTFPLIPIGKTYLGLSLDNYAYFMWSGKRVNFYPVIPLCLTFIF